MASNRSPRLTPMACPDLGRADALYRPAVRFVAARRHVGACALMRRFKIGRQRAYDLLVAMRDDEVVYRGHWRGVYRVHHCAWPWLLAVESDAYAPGVPGGYQAYRDRRRVRAVPPCRVTDSEKEKTP